MAKLTSPDQQKAISDAKEAQIQFQVAAIAYRKASQDRALSITAAVDTGITQVGLAERLGVSQATISVIVKRSRMKPPQMNRRIEND